METRKKLIIFMLFKTINTAAHITMNIGIIAQSDLLTFIHLRTFIDTMTMHTRFMIIHVGK